MTSKMKGKASYGWLWSVHLNAPVTKNCVEVVFVNKTEDEQVVMNLTLDEAHRMGLALQEVSKDE